VEEVTATETKANLEKQEIQFFLNKN